MRSAENMDSLTILFLCPMDMIKPLVSLKLGLKIVFPIEDDL